MGGLVDNDRLARQELLTLTARLSLSLWLVLPAIEAEQLAVDDRRRSPRPEIG